MDSAVAVGQPLLQASLIRLPGHTIDPGGYLSLPRVETLPKPFDAEMVE